MNYKLKYCILIAVLMTMSNRVVGQANPVIIELFTSQGCSSCPAADKNLNEIVKQAEADGQPVYGLSFHVDYWNYIGWKDPYSQKAFTERQQKYAELLGTTGIYTPQMVVNGEREFVGSDKSEAERLIQEAMNQKPVYQIVISDLTTTDGLIKFAYILNNPPHGELLNVALVERSLENFVPKGENKGKNLNHTNVVRVFKTVPLQAKDKIELNLNSNLQSASLIVFAQNKQGHVVAAVVNKIR